MSSSELADIVAPVDVLTNDEGYQVLRYINAGSSKPDNFPFDAQPRVKIEPRPRLLTAPAPYARTSCISKLQPGKAYSLSSTTSCTVSRPLLLKTVYVHGHNISGMSHTLIVTLKQNGNCLHKYTGHPSVIPEQSPEHFAVGVGDVRVEPGAMELVIHEILLTFHDNIAYAINRSSSELSRVSDDYVTITFPATKGNLLLGIEYCIP